MAAVEFKKIVKSYGTVKVIENLDLQIEPGEFVVLLGPSGCGKTTLLNLLAGLLEVDEGTITIGGRDVTDLDPKDRGLAMVFQSYALYPTKTVRGNMRFGLSARQIPADEVEQRISSVAKLLQIDHLLDRKPAELSGGQRQRVAIGRALVKQVDVLLFDEPLSNLDAKLRVEMRMEIKKLHQRFQNTVVFVTHDQVEAMTLATRIAVMDQGVVQQVGSPDEIYDQPANLFVADFVGVPSMNVIDGVIKQSNGSLLAVDPRNDITLDLARYRFSKPPEIDAPVKIGFRAEHFLMGQEASSGRTVPFPFPVEYVEKSGPEAIAYLALNDSAVAVRVTPEVLEGRTERDSLPISLSLDKLNLFDARSGRRL